MRLTILILTALCLIGCDKNRNKDGCIEYFENDMYRPHGYFTDVALNWDMQSASYRKALGEWGQNEKPDTAYGIDTTGTLLLWTGRDCGVGFDRLCDSGALYRSNAKKREKVGCE